MKNEILLEDSFQTGRAWEMPCITCKEGDADWLAELLLHG